MSNPVFNQLETQWKQQAPASAPQGASSGMPTDRPLYDQQAFDQARASYQAPAADAVAMGRMTYDDVIVKTSVSLAVAIGAAAVAWFATAASPAVGMPLLLVGLLGGFIIAMVNIFSKTVRPALVLLYAGLEGLALGTLSFVVNASLPGVVVQAVVATFAVFLVTLALFASGKVRNSPKLQKFALISLLGIILARVFIWLLAMAGVSMGGVGGPTIMGIPLGVALSFFAVFIGAICLISDFDQVKVGVERGVPAKYSWMSAFGIMVTLIWLYVEILNILSHLNSR